MSGFGATTIAKDESNLVVRAAKEAFEHIGAEMPPLRFECVNGIQCGAGMGSSSAAIIGGIAAAFAYMQYVPDEPLEELLQVAAKLEGHVDNIAPCLYGGLRLGWGDEGGHWHTVAVPVPAHVKCLVFVPDGVSEIDTASDGVTKTGAARAILSPTVSRHDAVTNISRAALLVHAFSSNNLKLLASAMEDTLHQVCWLSIDLL